MLKKTINNTKNTDYQKLQRKKKVSFQKYVFADAAHDFKSFNEQQDW